MKLYNCTVCGYLLDNSGVCGECPTTYDPVNRPSHYNLDGGIECIDYIKQVLGLDGFIAYCHGNLIKYQHRHNYKGKPLEDLEKAQYYMNRMVEALKEKAAK
tara:strand:- start:2154 stop:2459 length:306 start_codon:yes stop_codon:yes gene_type:complete